MSETRCPIYWGSHGCDLPAGHESIIHRCGVVGEPCSEFEITDGDWRTRVTEFTEVGGPTAAVSLTTIPGRIRYHYVGGDDDDWSKWFEDSEGFHIPSRVTP